jgi:hypothetical protein
MDQFTSRPNTVLREASTRRGGVLVLAAGVLVLVLGFAAFSIDLGFLCLTKAGLQGAADAASRAASQELIKGFGLGSLPQSQVEAMSRLAAVEVAALNENGDVDSTFVHQTRDIRFGHREWNTATETWEDTWGDGPYNLVEVTAHRWAPDNSEVDLFFGAVIMGNRTAVLLQKSVVFVPPAAGFRIPPGTGCNAMIPPIAEDLGTWNDLLLNDPSLPDDYTLDYSTGEVTNGPDGIREINLYPKGNGSLPTGNRGTVDIGHPGNSTADLKRQILHGCNEYDLSFFPNNELRFDQGPLYLNGDTGLSAGIKNELAQIIGQPRAIPLFINVSGNGNNATYTVVKFAGVRLVAVKLTGPPKKKYVMAQPSQYTDCTLVRGNLNAGVDGLVATPIFSN